MFVEVLSISNGEEMYFSVFAGFDEGLLMVVDVLVVFKFLCQGID